MTSPLRLSLCLLLALSLIGCDDGPTDADGGGLDAASADAGMGAGDAGDSATPDVDGGGSDGGAPSLDAGPGSDGGPPPSDGGPSDGGPVEPDAGPPEPCDSPGAVETLACGNCGTVDRFCSAGRTWAYGECTDEGECAAGTSDSTTCGNCGLQARRCSTECAWVDMGGCTMEGECAPGAMQTRGDGCPSGQLREFTCDATCTFAPSSACSAEACPTPGTLETLPCGMCGTRERFCNSSNAWEYSACMGEGACMPGSTGTLACGMCGTQPAQCNASCAWMPTSGGVCSGEGSCSPGMRRRTSAGCPSGETRLLECDASCGYTIVAEGCRASVPVDVLFLPDATGSNWFDFRDQRAAFISGCVDPLLAITEVQVGLAYYGDFGTFPETFEAAVEIGLGTSAAISSSIAAQGSIGRADDATMEALHILTGGTPQPGATPFVCSGGRVSGGCWRPGAQRVIVMHTDEYAKGGPDPTGPGLANPWPTGPDWNLVRPRLLSDGTLLFVIVDDNFFGPPDPVAQYGEMISDLGQPAGDVYVEAAGVPNGISAPCASIVARVRALAGM